MLLYIVCFFIPHSLYIQSLNRPGKFSPCIFFLCLSTFAAVETQPSKNTLILRLTFSDSPTDIENIFLKSNIASNVNCSSWLGLECLQYKFIALHFEANTYFLGKKLFHQHFLPFLQHPCELKKTLKGARSVNRLLSSSFLLSNATFFQYSSSFVWVWLIKSVF